MRGMESVKYLKLIDDTLEHATSEIFTYCYYSKFVVNTSGFLTNILKQTFFLSQ
jgi:ferritin-like protein